MLQPTNATKATVSVFINSWLAVLAVFGVGTQEQLGVVGLAVNATVGLYVALTYKDSPKRVPDSEG